MIILKELKDAGKTSNEHKKCGRSLEDYGRIGKNTLSKTIIALSLYRL